MVGVGGSDGRGNKQIRRSGYQWEEYQRIRISGRGSKNLIRWYSGVLPTDLLIS